MAALFYTYMLRTFHVVIRWCSFVRRAKVLIATTNEDWPISALVVLRLNDGGCFGASIDVRKEAPECEKWVWVARRELSARLIFFIDT